MKELVEYIARSLVDAPDEVEVEELEEDDELVYELTVAQSDLGRVIGKQGRTARAIRSVLSAASSKAGERAVLEILD